MNIMVDLILLKTEKLKSAQSMAWGGDKTSGFLLALGDCHNFWSDWNCGYWLIAADRTRHDEHNGWLDLWITLKNEYRKKMAWGGDKTIGFLLYLGDYQNIWSDLNYGYQLIAADRTRQDEQNGWSDTFLNLKIEYSPEHSMGRRQKKPISISLGGSHNDWSD